MNAHTHADSGATAIPSPDHAAIRSHVEMLHTLAKNAGVDGVLAFTRIDDKNKTYTEKFAIGDVDCMTEAIFGWSTHPSLNIYMSHAIFRKNLPGWSTGEEEDVLAVLSLVGDLDLTSARKPSALTGFHCPRPTWLKRLLATFMPRSHLGAHCLHQMQRLSPYL